MIIKQLIKSKTIRLQMLNHQRLVIQIAKIVQVVSNLLTPSIVQSQGGGTQVTSGTLELYQDTPVYASPDKSSEVAYTYPKVNVDWDQYVFENGENWYSFVVSNGTESKRYYIAYSDVKH